MTDDLIERTARAICEERTWPGAWLRANELETDAWKRDARAAIAIIAPAVLDMAADACLTMVYDLNASFLEEAFIAADGIDDAIKAILAIKAQFQTEGEG